MTDAGKTLEKLQELNVGQGPEETAERRDARMTDAGSTLMAIQHLDGNGPREEIERKNARMTDAGKTQEELTAFLDNNVVVVEEEEEEEVVEHEEVKEITKSSNKTKSEIIHSLAVGLVERAVTPVSVNLIHEKAENVANDVIRVATPVQTQPLRK